MTTLEPPFGRLFRRFDSIQDVPKLAYFFIYAVRVWGSEGHEKSTFWRRKQSNRLYEPCFLGFLLMSRPFVIRGGLRVTTFEPSHGCPLP